MVAERLAHLRRVRSPYFGAVPPFPPAPSPAGLEKHPDIFTEEEAAAYLHLEGVRSLEWVEREFKLPFHKVGRQRMYHREDLDLVARKMFGKDLQQPAMRLARGRA